MFVDREDAPKSELALCEQGRGYVLTDPQTAAELQEKLAALKKWTHLDGFNKESFGSVQDVLLYNMMWDDWDASDDTSPSDDETNRDADITDEHAVINLDVADAQNEAYTVADVEEFDSELPAKKARTEKTKLAIFDGLDGVLDSESEDDGDDDEVIQPRPSTGNTSSKTSRSASPLSSRLARFSYRPSSSPEKAQPSNTPSNAGEIAITDEVEQENDIAADAISTEAVSGDVEEQVTARRSPRKRTSDGKTKDGKFKVKGSKTPTGDNDFGFGRKHDLRKVADKGPAGRVMFVFERISASRM